MSVELKNFILKITAITLACAVVGSIVFSFFLQKYYLTIFPFTLLFFFLFTLFIHTYQLKLARKNLAKFTRSNMLMTFFKLSIYCIFTFIYLANDKENAIPFVIVVMILYVVFTSLEVSELMRIARTPNKEK